MLCFGEFEDVGFEYGFGFDDVFVDVGVDLYFWLVDFLG